MAEIEFPPIFCIYYSPEEKSSMTREFTSLGIGEVVSWIEAPEEGASTIDYYSHGLIEGKEHVRRYASHLTAIRAVIRSGAPRGFICESGVKLNPNFLGIYCDTYKKLEGEPIISFSGEGDTSLKFYLISRDYAAEIIATCDKPFARIQEEKLRDPISIVTRNQGKFVDGFLTKDREIPKIIRYEPLVVEVEI